MIASTARSVQTSINTATVTHVMPVKCRSKSHVTCVVQKTCCVDAAFKLHATILSNSGHWSSRQQMSKTLPTWHNINPAVLWPAAHMFVNVTKCLKFLVPKWSKRYRNWSGGGPKCDRYRTCPNPISTT